MPLNPTGRMLVTNQAAMATNGIYTVTSATTTAYGSGNSTTFFP